MTELSRRGQKVLCLFSALLTLAVTTEWFYFRQVLIKHPSAPPLRTDLLVVFPGESNRLATGLSFLQKGSAESLLVSGLGAQHLGKFAEAIRSSGNGTLLLTDPTPTWGTFGDALHTSQAIKAQGFKSVLLVTSGYHLPRAGLMLKILLLGRDVRVDWLSSEKAKTGDAPAPAPASKYAAEMIKLWGNLFEFACYAVSGELPQSYAPLRSAALSSKRWIDIGAGWLD
jgi:uncharacterized SAM-binding protein YcdF (DUF218 family)